jgi:epoxide hydrolase 4
MSDKALQRKINFEYAQIGGVRLHYATAGNGPKLILLLHGFPEFWYSWRHQIADLSDEYTVVAPDMRGYNLSDKPENVADYEIDKLVDDAVGLILQTGRERAFVVGHDWGAAVAWALAAKHPEYVEKLVALQVPPPPVMKQNQSFRQFLASWYMFFFQIPFLPEWLLSLDDHRALAEGLRKSTAEPDVFTAEEIAEYKKSWSEPNTISSGLNYYRANVLKRIFSKPDPDYRIKVPTLFIFGEQDTAILPETVEGIGEFIDAEYEEIRIPTSGHWVQQEAAPVVTDSIREFIGK